MSGDAAGGDQGFGRLDGDIKAPEIQLRPGADHGKLHGESSVFCVMVRARAASLALFFSIFSSLVFVQAAAQKGSIPARYRWAVLFREAQKSAGVKTPRQRHMDAYAVL
jgi:hypothetical protein